MTAGFYFIYIVNKCINIGIYSPHKKHYNAGYFTRLLMAWADMYVLIYVQKSEIQK